MRSVNRSNNLDKFVPNENDEGVYTEIKAFHSTTMNTEKRKLLAKLKGQATDENKNQKQEKRRTMNKKKEKKKHGKYKMWKIFYD